MVKCCFNLALGNETGVQPKVLKVIITKKT